MTDLSDIPELTRDADGTYRPAKPETTVAGFLNNLFLHFPGSSTIDLDLGHYRVGCNEFNEWNKTPRHRGAVCDGNSDLRLDQTHADFYALLDRVAEEAGVSAGVRAFNIRWVSGESGPDRYEEMWRIFIPIYVAMRKLGYTQRDLIA